MTNWKSLKQQLIDSKYYYFHTDSGVLLCGNCLRVMEKIPNDTIDLVIADPPYVKVVKADWDKKDIFTDDLIFMLKNLMKEHASIYIWCGIGEKSQPMIDWFLRLKKYFYFKDLITWKKQRGMGNRKGWLYTREEIMWFVKNNKKFIWNKEEQYSNKKRKSQNFGFKEHKRGYRPKSEYYRITNVWIDIPEPTWKANSLETIHLTPKPEEAIKRIIKVHTKENNIILDPFLGSGTTAIACEKLNRRWIGIEINEEHCEITKERISSFKLSINSKSLFN
ncbi:MAG: DNA-methyltransferase [Candidatus Heimdallarchaeaceae archaeon]